LIDRGESTLRLPLEKRRERLAAALAKVEYPVIQSSPLEATPTELVRAAQELGIEGLRRQTQGIALRAWPAERCLAQVQD
jgi:ATP-dependent DNA ligase